MAHGNVGGNYCPKYTTHNPVARWLVSNFLSTFDELSNAFPAKSVVEAGCGEGTLSLRLLERGIKATGFDIDANVVAIANDKAKRAGFGHPFQVGSVYDLTPVSLKGCDLLVCCEVLEHVPDPEAALYALAHAGAVRLVLSAPREPIWRVLNMARLNYLGELGNTPGHVNHWSKQNFLRFIENQLEVLEIRTPLPWTMALCAPRARQ